MNKSLFTLFLIGTFILLSGCSTTTHQVIEKVNYIHVPVGKALTSNIIPALPPDKVDYINSSYEERTNLLTEYIYSLLKTTKDLNNRLTAISELDEKNRLVVEKANKDEEVRVKALMEGKVQLIKDNIENNK